MGFQLKRNKRYSLSIFSCAATIAAMFATAPAGATGIVVRESSINSSQDLTARSPAICLAMKQLTLASSLQQSACELPLTEKAGYKRPVWENLSPLTHLPVIKEAAFWMFWLTRGRGRNVEGESVPAYKEFLAKLVAEWPSDASFSHTAVRRLPSDPPLNIDRPIELGWAAYGSDVLRLIAENRIELSVAKYDLNGDGVDDKVYRLSRLDFGFPKQNVKPQLQLCQEDQASAVRPTEILFVSSSDDPVLSRSFFVRSFVSTYDAFLFRGGRYIANRGLGETMLGWISRVRPNGPSGRNQNSDVRSAGIAIQPVCQFDPEVSK